MRRQPPPRQPPPVFASPPHAALHCSRASPQSSIALALKSGDKVVYKDPRQEFFTVATTGYMLVGRMDDDRAPLLAVDTPRRLTWLAGSPPYPDLLITSVGALFYKRFRDPGLIIHHTIAIPTLYYLSVSWRRHVFAPLTHSPRTASRDTAAYPSPVLARGMLPCG